MNPSAHDAPTRREEASSPAPSTALESTGSEAAPSRPPDFHENKTVKAPPPSATSPSVGPASAPDLALPRGLQVRYRLIRILGKGGFANVYLAYDNVLDQQVAIKFLKLGLASRTDHERFLQEARIGAKLRHPNISTVFDIIQTPDGLQLIMEFYPGGTLTDLIKASGALRPREAVDVSRQVAQALAYAHRHSFVHRDVKPANIFFAGEGMVKLGDFGIAAQAEVHEYTQTGMIIGTPLYMAPEQASDSRDVDPRTDIYALGLTLYHMLTGRPPRVVDLDSIPTPFRKLIKAATAANRNERLVSAEQFIAMLDQIQFKVVDNLLETAAQAAAHEIMEELDSQQPTSIETPALPGVPIAPLASPATDAYSASPPVPAGNLRGNPHPAWLVVAGLVVVVAALAFAVLHGRPRAAKAPSIIAATVTPEALPPVAMKPAPTPTATTPRPTPPSASLQKPPAFPTATPSLAISRPPVTQAKPTPSPAAPVVPKHGMPQDRATVIQSAIDQLRREDRAINSALSLIESLQPSQSLAAKNLVIGNALGTIEHQAQNAPQSALIQLIAGLACERAGRIDAAQRHYFSALDLDRAANQTLALAPGNIITLRRNQGLPVGPLDRTLLGPRPPVKATR